MAAQAIFLDEVHQVKSLRYSWSEDGALLLTLDCWDPECTVPVTFAQLWKLLCNLCSWQLSDQVIIGLKHALAEVVTVYHAFEFAREQEHSLMLVCTPPDEYFGTEAA